MRAPWLIVEETLRSHTFITWEKLWVGEFIHYKNKQFFACFWLKCGWVQKWQKICLRNKSRRQKCEIFVSYYTVLVLFVLHCTVLSEIWKMILMMKHDDTSTFTARLKVVFYTLQIYKKSWKCIFHCHCCLSSSSVQSSKQYQYKVRNYRNMSNPLRDVISNIDQTETKKLQIWFTPNVWIDRLIS